ALVIGVAAITPPAPDREEKADAGDVCHARKLQVVRPTAGPALQQQRDRESRGAVRPEQANLELVRIVHRHAVLSGWSGSEHGFSWTFVRSGRRQAKLAEGGRVLNGRPG